MRLQRLYQHAASLAPACREWRSGSVADPRDHRIGAFRRFHRQHQTFADGRRLSHIERPSGRTTFTAVRDVGRGIVEGAIGPSTPCFASRPGAASATPMARNPSARRRRP